MGSWIYNYLCNWFPITTKVVSSKLAHDEVYLIQHYVIKFVSDLWHVGGLPHSFIDNFNIREKDTTMYLICIMHTIADWFIGV
jgi:hypothetical protein